MKRLLTASAALFLISCGTETKTRTVYEPVPTTNTNTTPTTTVPTQHTHDDNNNGQDGDIVIVVGGGTNPTNIPTVPSVDPVGACATAATTGQHNASYELDTVEVVDIFDDTNNDNYTTVEIKCNDGSQAFLLNVSCRRYNYWNVGQNVAVRIKTSSFTNGVPTFLIERRR